MGLFSDADSVLQYVALTTVPVKGHVNQFVELCWHIIQIGFKKHLSLAVVY